MEELTINVANSTAEVLRKVATDANISIGEVVDRAVLVVAPDNPVSAFIIALEQYLVCVSRLNKEDAASVFGNMCGIFLGSLPLDELDDIVSNIKNDKRSGKYTMEPISEEESLAIKKSMDRMLCKIEDEQIRELIYTLFRE